MAKRFRFRLEVVRKLRKRAEDQQRRVVAERFRQVNAVREQIDGLTALLEGEHASIRQSVSGGREGCNRLDMDDLRRHHVHISQLHRSLAAARGELTRLRGELEEEQGRLAEASKQVKVLDKLEERQRARYDTALKRAELADADEVAAQFVRRVAVAAAGTIGGGAG